MLFFTDQELVADICQESIIQRPSSLELLQSLQHSPRKHFLNSGHEQQQILNGSGIKRRREDSRQSSFLIDLTGVVLFSFLIIMQHQTATFEQIFLSSGALHAICEWNKAVTVQI